MITGKIAEAETKRIRRSTNSGFTMVEILVTASIIIILLAIGVAGIMRYRNYLRITELDNMARSIYMAAQNRAVLLDNDRRFQTLVRKGTLQADGTFGGGCTRIIFTDPDSAKERWYIDSRDIATGDVLDDLLPVGTIDPALRDGRFYIVYEPDSASVTDVFYIEDQSYDLKDFESSAGIAAALEKLGGDDNRDERMTNKPVMVGWFGSNGAAGREEGLSMPFVEVSINNGNELTVTVKFKMPDSLPEGATVVPKPNVTLTYGGKEVRLMYVDETTQELVTPYMARLTDETEGSNIAAATESETVIYTWVLDSLAKKSGASQQFKGLKDGAVSLTDPGGDFTVTASLVLTADGYKESNPASHSKTDNSLFATDTHDGSTAYIANLRHLQNLDTEYSAVREEITTAEQTAAIDADKLKNNKGDEIETDSKYEFKPISNENLTCYQDERTLKADGTEIKVESPHYISGLTVTTESARGEGAGLFEKVNNFTFKNVWLKDPNVTGSAGSKYIGGLVGSVSATGSVSFRYCKVENTNVHSDSAESIGGLVGSAEVAGTLSFTDCKVVAGITVTGTVGTAVIGAAGNAGGMVGYSGSGDVRFENCEVNGLTVTSTNNSAGGLLGYKVQGPGKVFFSKCKVGLGGEKPTDIRGKNNAGGLAGETGAIECSECAVGNESDANGKITVIANNNASGNKYAGGMVGNSAGGSFSKCAVVNAEVTSSGSGSGESMAGGLAGQNSGRTTVSFEDCSVKNIKVSTGTSTGHAGGMMGYKGDGGSVTFTRCLVEADEATLITGANAGGMLGCTKNPENDVTTASFTECTVGKADDTEDNTADDTEDGTDKKVTVTTTTGCAGGLAGNITGGSFIGCQVVSTNVQGTGGGSIAGGMAGSANQVTFEPAMGEGDTVGTKCRVENVTVKAKKRSGGLAGVITAGGSFEYCEVVSAEVSDTGEAVAEGSEVTDSYAGGLAGGAGSAGFDHCVVRGLTVTANGLAGGLAGYSIGGSFNGCETIDARVGSTVTAAIAGGMAGYSDGETIRFSGCRVAGTEVTSGSSVAGGMAGKMTDGSFTGCQVVDTTVMGTEDGSIAGGMAGSANQVTFEPAIGEGGTVGTKCRVENVTVKAKKRSGGLAGIITAGGSFEYCEVVSAEVSDTGEGEVTDSSAGGLAGDAGSAGFNHCVVRGITVTANGLAGGLAGAAGSSYSNCQVPNATIKGSYAGGLVGDTGATQFTNCTVTGCTVGKSEGEDTAVTDTRYAGGLTGMSWGGAAFKGCEVVDTNVNSTASAGEMPYSGGLTGASGGESVRFENCIVSGGTVSGSYCAGGMAGHNYNSAVEFINCGIKQITVTAGGMSAGGLLAYKTSDPGTENVNNVKFTNCTVGKFPKKDGETEEETKAGDAVTITAQGRAGGLLGYVDNNCHAIFNGCQVFKATVTANFTWDAAAGGLAGKTGKNTQFINCTAGGENGIENISVTARIYAGGLAGASVDSSFSNCQTVNATVTATEWNGRAGGLVGRLVNYQNTVKNTDPTVISGCKVYWTHSLPATTNDLQTVDYKIRANGSEGMAGGLVGEIATAKATILNSFAASFVYGGGYVGGLTGYLSVQATEDQWGNSSAGDEAPSLHIEKSYADCYIMLKGGTGWYAAGGLVGSNEKAELTLKDVYAAGFITIHEAEDKGNFSGDYAAGLCGGNANLKVENAYAAMHYDQGNRIPYIFPLAKKATPVNSFYLYNSNYVVTSTGGWYEIQASGTPYGQMADLALGDAFVMPPSQTHPYNIYGTQRSGSYPFPGLKGLPHYGDWVISSSNDANAILDENQETDGLQNISGGDLVILEPGDSAGLPDMDEPTDGEESQESDEPGDSAELSKEASKSSDVPPPRQPEALIPPEDSRNGNGTEDCPEDRDEPTDGEESQESDEPGDSAGLSNEASESSDVPPPRQPEALIPPEDNRSGDGAEDCPEDRDNSGDGDPAGGDAVDGEGDTPVSGGNAVGRGGDTS